MPPKNIKETGAETMAKRSPMKFCKEYSRPNKSNSYSLRARSSYTSSNARLEVWGRL